MKQGIFYLLLMLFSTLNSYAADTIQVKFTNTITQEYECTVGGRVVKVTDGDTVEVLDADKTKHKIRLSGIDAPERKQAWVFLPKSTNRTIPVPRPPCRVQK